MRWPSDLLFFFKLMMECFWNIVDDTCYPTSTLFLLMACNMRDVRFLRMADESGTVLR